eukprot:TRINITY_DN1831_c0_g1_i4.p1 TRINITY_DN1831_c0_g1~~TRINITY_DN1831_c0_g1_i4.p1  ORF type:complete len:666 (-),score=139.66 TRINITY_DN1831_c0_g1_i4:512-2509(-)
MQISNKCILPTEANKNYYTINKNSCNFFNQHLTTTDDYVQWNTQRNASITTTHSSPLSPIKPSLSLVPPFPQMNNHIALTHLICNDVSQIEIDNTQNDNYVITNTCLFDSNIDSNTITPDNNNHSTNANTLNDMINFPYHLNNTNTDTYTHTDIHTPQPLVQTDKANLHAHPDTDIHPHPLDPTDAYTKPYTNNDITFPHLLKNETVSKLLQKTVTLRDSSSSLSIDVTFRYLLQQFLKGFERAGVSLIDDGGVCLVGSTASGLVAHYDTHFYTENVNDFDILFRLKYPENFSEILKIQESVIAMIVRDKTGTMLTLTECYGFFKECCHVSNDTERWSLVSMGTDSLTVDLKVVYKAARCYVFSVDSFEIVLDHILKETEAEIEGNRKFRNSEFDESAFSGKSGKRVTVNHQLLKLNDKQRNNNYHKNFNNNKNKGKCFYRRKVSSRSSDSSDSCSTDSSCSSDSSPSTPLQPMGYASLDSSPSIPIPKQLSPSSSLESSPISPIRIPSNHSPQLYSSPTSPKPSINSSSSSSDISPSTPNTTYAIVRSCFGDYREALTHLVSRKLVTRNAGEIRHGLFRYCLEIARGYRPETFLYELIFTSHFYEEFGNLDKIVFSTTLSKFLNKHKKHWFCILTTMYNLLAVYTHPRSVEFLEEITKQFFTPK